jgi:hypothetical protein
LAGPLVTEGVEVLAPPRQGRDGGRIGQKRLSDDEEKRGIPLRGLRRLRERRHH